MNDKIKKSFIKFMRDIQENLQTPIGKPINEEDLAFMIKITASVVNTAASIVAKNPDSHREFINIVSKESHWAIDLFEKMQKEMKKK